MDGNTKKQAINILKRKKVLDRQFRHYPAVIEVLELLLIEKKKGYDFF